MGKRFDNLGFFPICAESEHLNVFSGNTQRSHRFTKEGDRIILPTLENPLGSMESTIETPPNPKGTDRSPYHITLDHPDNLEAALLQ